MVVGMLKDGKASDRGGGCGGVVKGQRGVAVARDSGPSTARTPSMTYCCTLARQIQSPEQDGIASGLSVCVDRGPWHRLQRGSSSHSCVWPRDADLAQAPGLAATVGR